MVLGEAIAAGAAGAHTLFSYNRGNFMYDKKQRQESEYQILEWRAAQAELWRSDIRDIIGLTEKKMDSYLVIATLTLGMSVGLFTEGRLEPGTPPWLLHFYMLTLGSAFMYLLMSVWLAFHASIVASCSSVRLLTQFVRLPVPTWEQLEGMRTYGCDYEAARARSMLRIPFAGRTASQQREVHSKRGVAADPWGWEPVGVDRELYELQEQPAALRRHVVLARRAARQYQCYDAFARVAMSFGVNQLLNAIAYYCLGYVAVQDGSPWPACCIVVIMTAIAMTMVHLDFSLTLRELRLAQVLIFSGPVCSACATCAWTLRGPRAEGFIMTMLPLAYASHGLWLFFALVAIGMEVQPNGALLPTKFRAVLYLDVFGWLTHKKGQPTAAAASPELAEAMAAAEKEGSCEHAYKALSQTAPPSPSQPGMAKRRSSSRSFAKALPELRRSLHRELVLWESAPVQRVLAEQDRARATALAERAREALREMPGSDDERAAADDDDDDEVVIASASGGSSGSSSSNSPASCGDELPMQKVQLRGYTEFGVEIPYIYDPESGETRLERDDEALSPRGPPRTLSGFQECLDEYSSAGAQDAAPAAASGGSGAGAGKPRARRGPAARAAGGCPFGEAAAAAQMMAQPVFGALDAFPGDGQQQQQGDRDGARHGATAAASDIGSMFGNMANPAGEVREPPAHAFHPVSYGPDSRMLAPNEAEEGDIVTGHDRIHPGKLPAKVFRLATLMLVAFWAMGLALPFGVFREFMTKPLTANIVVEEMGPGGEKHGEEEVEAAIGTAPDGMPELIPEYARVRKLPPLLDPELVRVNWPAHAGFVPRALSCDPSGKRLVVADDLGVYAGQLQQAVEDILDIPALGGPQGTRRLLAEPTATPPAPMKTVRFERLPPCAALEGQALKDIAVVCAVGGGGEAAAELCRVVVLHARGRRLAECPMHPVVETDAEEEEELEEEEEAEEGAGEAAAQQQQQQQQQELTPQEASSLLSRGLLLSPVQVDPVVTWKISEDWLHSKELQSPESVDSLAVNSDCLDQGDQEGALRGEVMGCVVVGTTSGRIVQLRGTYAEEHSLVPERAMEQRSRSIGPGSLHVFPNGYVVALRHSTGTVQAFDSELGTSIGEWRLPKKVHWLSLCGGGNNLFILGLRNGTRVELYRFPVPAELRGERRAPGSTEAHGSGGSAGGMPVGGKVWHLRGLGEGSPRAAAPPVADAAGSSTEARHPEGSPRAAAPPVADAAVSSTEARHPEAVPGGVEMLDV